LLGPRPEQPPKFRRDGTYKASPDLEKSIRHATFLANAKKFDAVTDILKPICLGQLLRSLLKTWQFKLNGLPAFAAN
jgi:hypothetical protein